MSDQTTPPIEEPAASVDSPEQGIDTQQQQATPQQDWERDYKELQREFTRTRQQMTDPEYQAQVAQEWLSQQGYALPDDDEPEHEYEDPTDALAARLEALEGHLSERQEQELRAQQVQSLEEQTEQKLAQIDGLNEDMKTWVVSRAISLPPAEDGGLDVAKAHQELEALLLERQRDWAKSKRAPYVTPGGQTANGPVLPPDATHEQRVAFAAQKYQEMTGDV